MNKDKKQMNEEEFEEEFFKEEKKSGFWVPIVISAIVLALSFGAMAFLVLDNIRRKADVGNKVVTEESVASPTKQPETVIIEKNKMEEAIATPTPTPLEEVPEATPVADIMETDVVDYSKVEFDIKRNLSEMEGYFLSNNLEALWDLAHLDRYIAMSLYFSGTSDYAYYGDLNEEGQPHGFGAAVYADNQYYYGEWKNGVREGKGMWLHYHIHLKPNKNDIITFHEYVGYFADDLPNGRGQDHYEYEEAMLKENAYYITNYICDFKNGLIEGAVYCTAIDGKDGMFEFEGKAIDGVFEYLSESRDKNKRGPVLTDMENPDNYIWLSKAENQKIGVSSYITKFMSE